MGEKKGDIMKYYWQFDSSQILFKTEKRENSNNKKKNPKNKTPTNI